MPNSGPTEFGYILSPYEKERFERIQKNAEHFKKLGLDKYQDFMKKKSPPKKQNEPTVLPRVKPGEERRSGRLASNGNTAEYDNAAGQDLYDDDDDDVEFFASSKPRSRKILIDRNNWKLSVEERESLAGSVNEDFLFKFQEFLEYHDHISEPNVRNVMRQIRKLASGEGIRYESPRYGWAEDCYFKKGEKITPMSDIIELMQIGRACENNWGRDHGNGWLISHPLKKLLLFQQFILNNPSFLNSKVKLKDYCGSYNNKLDAGSHDVKPPKKKQEQPKTTLIPKRLELDSGEEFMNKRIAKDFNGVIFFGTLDGYCPKNCYWRVLYDDGDSEELSREEIELGIAHQEKNKSLDMETEKDHSNPNGSCKRNVSNRSVRVSRSQKKVKVGVVTP